MTTPNASFSYCFADGTLRIEGSELFVAQQVDEFREKILESLEGVGQPAVAIPQITHLPDASSANANQSTPVEGKVSIVKDVGAANPYPRVLDVMGDKLKITTSIKGKTNAEKTINVILAYLWGKENLLDQPTAEYKELRELCEEHGCLDSGNFSSTLSSKKNLILIDGAKGSNTKICKLTYPGKEEAETVLNQLNEGGK